MVGCSFESHSGYVEGQVKDKRRPCQWTLRLHLLPPLLWLWLWSLVLFPIWNSGIRFGCGLVVVCDSGNGHFLTLSFVPAPVVRSSRTRSMVQTQGQSHCSGGDTKGVRSSEETFHKTQRWKSWRRRIWRSEC